MKKLLRFASLLLVLLTAVTLCAKEAHTLYLVRHGQVGDPKCVTPKLKHKVRDVTLTKLGEQQAKRLGAYLKKCNYKGPIYSSPLYRSMQTASFICDALDAKFTIEPDVQEHSSKKGGSPRLVTYGCDLDEFTHFFPRCIIPNGMSYPWRLDNENEAQRSERVEKAMDRLLAKHPGDLMIVSHGGTMTALKKILAERGGKPHGFNWNCCLLIYKLDENGKVISCQYVTDQYLPDSMQTDNLHRTKKQNQQKNQKKSRKK